MICSNTVPVLVPSAMCFPDGDSLDGPYYHAPVSSLLPGPLISHPAQAHLLPNSSLDSLLLVGLTPWSPLCPAVVTYCCSALIYFLKTAKQFVRDQSPQKKKLGLKNKTCTWCQVLDTCKWFCNQFNTLRILRRWNFYHFWHEFSSINTC